MMFSNCLILLCIGVYATCYATPRPKNMQIRIMETQAYLDEAMKQQVTDITDMVDIPRTLTETCAKHNLDAFINSLNLVTQFRSDIFTKCLKEVANHWPQSEKSHDCKASKGTVEELLEDLKYLLKELRNYMDSKETTTQNTRVLRALLLKRKIA